MFIHSRIILLALVLATGATLVAAPLGTGFTYQGVLSDGGSPASGAFDFIFLLYDSTLGGSQVGSTVQVDDLTVTDGRFTTVLDFGAVFDGSAVWLEVHVRDGASGGAYSVLSPRQELTAAPYALHATSAQTASSATTATSADNAAQLGGQSPSFYLAWSNLTGLPGGLNDGDDDTLGELMCATGEIAKLNDVGTWECAPDAGAWAATFGVGPVGTDLENGAALLAAAAALPAGTRSRLVVEPGAYDLGDQGLAIPSNVTVSGAGQGATHIRSTVCTSPTVDLDNYSELFGVSINNSCASGSATAVALQAGYANTVNDLYIRHEGDAYRNRGISVSSDVFVLRNAYVLVASGSGIDSRGVYVYGTGVLENVDVTVTGGTDTTTGIEGNSILDLENVSVELFNGGAETCGVRTPAGAATHLRGVRAEVTSIAGTAYGIRVQAGNSAPAMVSDVIAVASDGGAGTSYGLYFARGVATADNVSLEGEVALFYDGVDPEGLRVINSTLTGSVAAIRTSATSGAFQVIVENSLLTGPSNTIEITGTAGPVKVAGSRLAGGGIIGASSTTCAGVWDEGYTFFASSCP